MRGVGGCSPQFIKPRLFGNAGIQLSSFANYDMTMRIMRETEKQTEKTEEEDERGGEEIFVI